jgi:nucleotide-binding universal stress UspA family protein
MTSAQSPDLHVRTRSDSGTKDSAEARAPVKGCQRRTEEVVVNAQRVIVGVDGSPESARAVIWAAREAFRRDSILHIVHVWHTPTSPGYPLFVPPTEILSDDAERSAKACVDDATKIALDAEPMLQLVAQIACGPAAQTLIGYTEGAQLLVIGGSDRSPLDRAMFGSVSTHVVRHAACPVAVVRGDQEAVAVSTLGVGPVVVGVDGSVASQGAVKFAMEYASAHNLSVVALQVWSTHDTDAFAGQWVLGDQDSTPILAAVETLFDDLKDRYPAVAVTVEAVYGRPVRELLQRAVLAELLVVGSHGRGYFTGMLLGSVSTALVHKASGTVVVVRPELVPAAA